MNTQRAHRSAPVHETVDEPICEPIDEPVCQPIYELRVEGHLDRHWSAWFGGLELTLHDDGTTTLRGPVADQAELHGLLAQVRDLGVPLLSVDSGRTCRRHDDPRGEAVR